MNEDVKALWIAELEDENNKQGRGALTRTKNGVEYDCCLGLLCKIAVKEGLDIKIDTFEYKKYLDTAYDEAESVLPRSVREWAGLDESNPVVDDAEHGRNSLAEFNDGGKTFKEIAGIVKRNL